MYYFAYGSNMDQTQMAERCPKVVLIGSARLIGYRLAFTIFSPKRNCGCADILMSSQDEVHGLLYSVTSKEMEALDRFEGHPNHYRQIQVTVNTQDGEVSAFSYEVVHKQDSLDPSKHYLHLITAAADLHNFPTSYRSMLSSIETSD